MDKINRGAVKDWNARVVSIDKEVDDLRESRELIVQKILALICPLKKGCRVEWTHGKYKQYGIVTEIHGDLSFKKVIEPSYVTVMPYLRNGKLSPRSLDISLRYKSVKISPILD